MRAARGAVENVNLEGDVKAEGRTSSGGIVVAAMAATFAISKDKSEEAFHTKTDKTFGMHEIVAIRTTNARIGCKT